MVWNTGKFGEGEKIWGVSKKKVDKNLGAYGQKNDDFRHISQIYRLEQSFFRSKKSEDKFLGLILYFLGLKSLKNKI